MPEFDLVAPVYDATRHPPSEAELDAVVAALEGPADLLEAGVGTGRYALPLTARGLPVTGIDISTEMMRRAREKGIARLVRADLNRLPFADGTFDAALIVHVLQLLPDPFRAIAELTRVARERVVAVVPQHGHGERRQTFRRRYRELAAARGIELPPRPRYWENGERLIAACPPTAVRRVEVPPDPDRMRSWEDHRSFGGFISVPEDVHREIVAEIRREMGDRERPAPRPRTLLVATWSAAARPSFLAHVGEAPVPVPT